MRTQKLLDTDLSDMSIRNLRGRTRSGMSELLIRADRITRTQGRGQKALNACSKVSDLASEIEGMLGEIEGRMG